MKNTALFSLYFLINQVLWEFLSIPIHNYKLLFPFSMWLAENYIYLERKNPFFFHRNDLLIFKNKADLLG